MIGNLDEDGYLAASEEELAAAFSQFAERVGRGGGRNGRTRTVGRLSWCGAASTWCSILTRPGVGARDLRECLLIQIAAQQHEFAHLYAQAAGGAGRGPASQLPRRGRGAA